MEHLRRRLAPAPAAYGTFRRTQCPVCPGMYGSTPTGNTTLNEPFDTKYGLLAGPSETDRVRRIFPIQ